MTELSTQARPIYVVGAGAVGLHLAARLSAVAPVTLVARGPRVHHLTAHGFTLAGAEAGEYRVPVVELPGLALPAEAIVLVAVKATQLAGTLAKLAPSLHPGQALGLCQNGLGVAAVAARAAPRAALIRVACWLGAQLEPPACVRVAGVFQLELAADGAPARSHMSELQAALTAAGYPVKTADGVAACEWRKSLWNLAVSGLCATLGERNGAILDSPPLHAFARELLLEAREVAAAEGVALRDEDLERVFLSTRSTRDNDNAMLQDLRRGAPTEIAFLNAEVASRARAQGLAAPLNAAVARLVEHLERRGP